MSRKERKMTIGALVVGMVLGVVLAAVGVILVMPKMMLVTHKSTLGFEETLAALDKGIIDNGWSSPGTIDMCKSLEKHGVECSRRVSVVQMCQPSYAKDVLTTDPCVSSLMPCAVGVWEGDDGAVYVSKMNTGLMGKLFGGNVATVMGGKVGKDERAILQGVVEAR